MGKKILSIEDVFLVSWDQLAMLRVGLTTHILNLQTLQSWDP